MIRVMDMNTGKIVEDEFGAFETEVLNAEWTPASMVAVTPGLQPVATGRTTSEFDAERFLAAVYRYQG